MKKSAIRSFVKGTLGCGCPDKVYNQIRYEVDVTLRQCQSPVSRIELGNRLLIYLLAADSADIIERDLPIVIYNGKLERDRRGFHRFRAVVCTGNIGAVVPLADDVFARCMDKDDRLHLHVVTREDVQAAIEADTGD